MVKQLKSCILIIYVMIGYVNLKLFDIDIYQ